MRVLMIVRQFFPWVGGTEKQAQKLAAQLIALGVEVKVVTGQWNWSLSRQEVVQTIPVFRNFTMWGMFGLKGLRKFSGYIYLLSLLWYLWRHRHEYDVIHIHRLNYAAFSGVLGGRWLGKKSIIKIANSGWGGDISDMQKSNMLPGQRHMLPVALKADRIVAINEEIVDELGLAGVPAERIAVIPNGVEVDGLRYKGDYKINSLATLIFVGRLHPQKALDVLLPAFKRVIQTRPGIEWRLWVCGDGPLRLALEALAQQLEIAPQVKFWGAVNNVATYLAQADIFLLPSRGEGMSNALLEAMAHGLPCIATQIGGNVDLIKDGENGLLVAPENEEALAEAILHLVDDESLRQKIGCSARQMVVAKYSVDSVAKKISQPIPLVAKRKQGRQQSGR